MKKPQAKEALELYKKFLVRMDKVAEFLKVAEVRTCTKLCPYYFGLTVHSMIFGLGMCLDTKCTHLAVGMHQYSSSLTL